MSDKPTYSEEQLSDLAVKIQHLEALGCTDIDSSDLFIDFETPNGDTCNIGVYDFTTHDDLTKVLRNSQKYTCCGDLIDYDGDSDLCPTCKEHC